MVDQKRPRLPHAPAHARGADASTLARKGHAKLGIAPAAAQANEAQREVTATGHALKFVVNEARQVFTPPVLQTTTKAGKMLAHDLHRGALLGATRDVSARSFGLHRRNGCES